MTIRQLQREGIEAAKKRGKHLGRPRIMRPDNFIEIYNRWRAGEYTAQYAMQALGIKKNTFYRMVKAYEESLVQNVV